MKVGAAREAVTPHTFLCDGKTWTVARQTREHVRRQTGLSFRNDDDARFMVFTRGALPSNRELEAMTEEVLCVLLRRAEVR